MAEAVVEDIPQPPQRFYCHLCSVEIDNVTTDFNCPHCSNGFIEELPNVVENRLDDVEMPELDPTGYVDISNRFTDEISSLLMSVTGTRPMDLELDEQESQSGVTNSGRGGRRGRRRYVHNLNNFNNILHEFLISVTGGAGATGTPMFFMGNPGDYAWGREGLDTIVTQLLNQMETTGPPPLTTEKIGEIPKVEITMEQVNEKLQCSVCWEDFQLKEFVRKLPCLHVYHESCIVPWLELHGTCPICRQSLSNENPEEQQRNTLSAAAAAAANSIRNVAALYRADSTQTPSYSQNQQVGESSTQTTSSTATTSTTTNDARQQNLQSQLNQTSNNRSSGFRDDDGNIDYEFD